MKQRFQISIAAFVSEDERAAVQLAASYIARSLGQADGEPWTCSCVFSPDLATLHHGGNATIIVTSFLPELGGIAEPWPQAEQRLRTVYAALRECRVPVFICTILRHIGRDEEPEAASRLRLHIRRLNLLAAEISRETEAYVIDVDRVLADIGARRLQTDYRLAGSAATDLVGHFIALTLLNNACDGFVSLEIQDAARAILISWQPAIARSNNSEPEVKIGNLLSMGHGQRKQIVWAAGDMVPEKRVGLLIQQVLRGTIGPVEAAHRLLTAVRRRGVRESANLTVSGLSKQIKRKK
jgi:hypothetical protein